jgi:hypothetical protein
VIATITHATVLPLPAGASSNVYIDNKHARSLTATRMPHTGTPKRRHTLSPASMRGIAMRCRALGPSTHCSCALAYSRGNARAHGAPEKPPASVFKPVKRVVRDRGAVR